jgi:hypothetical protein
VGVANYLEIFFSTGVGFFEANGGILRERREIFNEFFDSHGRFAPEDR